jgi:hypothetical protein
MAQLMRLHADSHCFATAQIEMEVARPRTDCLAMSYIATGKIRDVHISPVAVPARNDKLWEHTCFEAFIRACSGAEYYEFNFAPSAQWAAYRFSSFRTGRCDAFEISAPEIEVQSSPDRYTLRASLKLDCLSALPCNSMWQLDLSAWIEETSGRKSYWALAHLQEKPDFHHGDCFVHEISPTGQP